MSNAKLSTSYDDKFMGMKLGKLEAQVEKLIQENNKLLAIYKAAKPITEQYTGFTGHLELVEAINDYEKD
jgi:hypothetical protein